MVLLAEKFTRLRLVWLKFKSLFWKFDVISLETKIILTVLRSRILIFVNLLTHNRQLKMPTLATIVNEIGYQFSTLSFDPWTGTLPISNPWKHIQIVWKVVKMENTNYLHGTSVTSHGFYLVHRPSTRGFKSLMFVIQ